jgi:hypothetical protein
LKSTVPLSSLNDEMPLYHLAVHANKFIQCATSLFFGYVDGATTIAENCGGGGPTSSSPWGRDEDEDDRKYQYFGKFFELVNEVKASICVKSL